MLLLALFGVLIGVSNISVSQVSNILGVYLFDLPITPDWTASQQVIITQLRLPRIVLAMLTGAGLAVAGAALQAATRNPLTDPFLLGVSSGASAGAVLVISHIGLVIGAYTMPVFSFIGGLFSFSLLIIMIQKTRNQSPERMVLAGVAISFLLMAATNGLIFLGDQRAAQSIVFWMLGGLGRARWDLLGIPSIIIISAILGLCWQARNLNALMMGQESAAALGISVNRARTTTLLLATLATSVIVSMTGTIGFVGLVVPHITRAFTGGDNRYLLPVCALVGAVFMLLVDILARLLLAPQELPIGLITGAIGGGYFCYLLMKHD